VVPLPAVTPVAEPALVLVPAAMLGVVVPLPAVTPVAELALVLVPTATVGAVVPLPAVTPVAEPALVLVPTAMPGVVVPLPAVTPVAELALVLMSAALLGAVALVLEVVPAADVPLAPKSLLAVSPVGAFSMLIVGDKPLLSGPPSADTVLVAWRPIAPPRPMTMARTSPTRAFRDFATVSSYPHNGCAVTTDDRCQTCSENCRPPLRSNAVRLAA